MIQLGDIKAYTVQEAAVILDVSAQTIRAYIKSGRVKSSKVGRRYMIEETELEKVIKGEI